MNEARDLQEVENAILAFLDEKSSDSIQELLNDFALKGYRESEIRRALWALLSAHEVDVTKDYSLRRTSVRA